MQAGDVMFHGSGQHLHQSTLGLSGWSVIAADPQRLADFYKVLTGEPLVILATASVLQPAGRMRPGCGRFTPRLPPCPV